MLQTNISSHLYGFTDLKSLNERGPLVISYGKGIYVYDTKGNKYLFKKDTVFCEEMDLVKGPSYLCEGSAIKTDVAGNKRAVSFDQAFCSPKIEWMICTAAQGLGIVPPNSKLIDHW